MRSFWTQHLITSCVTPSSRLGKALQQLGGTPLWFMALRDKDGKFLKSLPSLCLGEVVSMLREKVKTHLPQAPSFPVHR